MDGDVIDLEKTKEMTDCFLEAGFRYFDTAYGYNDGESEKAAKAALVDRYPEGEFPACHETACMGGGKEQRRSTEDVLYLRWNGPEPDILTFYLLHNLGEERTHFFDDYGIWDFLQEKKKRGTDPSSRLFHARQNRYTYDRASGDGVRAAADQLCGLG